MNVLPPEQEQPDNHPGSFKSNALSLAASLRSSLWRLIQAGIVSGKLQLLWVWSLPIQHRTLGARSYALNLHRDITPDAFAKVDALSNRLKLLQTVEDQSTPSPTQRIMTVYRRVVASAKAVPLKLKLHKAYTNIGRLVENHASSELGAEKARVSDVQTAIATAQALRTEIRNRDTGLKKHTTATIQNGFALAIRTLTSLRARWHRLVAGTVIERIKPAYWMMGIAVIATASIATWSFLEYRPIDENDPQAVAWQADRLAGHPGDSANPSGTSGASDEKLMSAEANARALDICIKAVEFFPDEPRHLFQLGRVLLLAGEHVEAKEFLSEAAGLGHAGAQAYLGRLEEDPQKALEIFKTAAASFPPAAEMATQTEAYINAVLAEAGKKADAVAAHPEDMARPKGLKGVSDDSFNTEQILSDAITACVDAVAAFPEEPRYRFQLGRVLLLAGADEAKTHLELAAKKEYGAALYYLATLQDDGLAALDLLRRSQKAGFKPAESLKKQVEAETGPDFEGEGYYFGDLLRALYDWNGEYMMGEVWENLNYIRMLHDAMEDFAPEHYSETVSNALDRDIMGVKAELEMAHAAAKLFPALASDLPSINDIDVKSSGLAKEDMKRLVSTYGQDSEHLKRITKTLKGVFN